MPDGHENLRAWLARRKGEPADTTDLNRRLIADRAAGPSAPPRDLPIEPPRRPINQVISTAPVPDDGFLRAGADQALPDWLRSAGGKLSAGAAAFEYAGSLGPGRFDPSTGERTPHQPRTGTRPSDLMRSASDFAFRSSQEQQDRIGAPEGGAETAGRLVSTLATTGADVIGTGLLTRKLARLPTPRGFGASVLADEAAVLPFDIATTERPEDSSANMIEQFLTPETIERVTSSPGEARTWKQRLARFGLDGVRQLATRANETRGGRLAFEATFGMAADVAIRGGARAGMAVAADVPRVMADTRGSLVLPDRVPGQVETGLPGRWRSDLNAAIETAPQERATAEQWAGMLRKAPGSQGEREWAGVDAFLQSKAGQPVTRAELLQHVNENGIRLTETVRGSALPREAQGQTTEQLTARADEYMRAAQEAQAGGRTQEAGNLFRRSETFTAYAEARELGIDPHDTYDAGPVAKFESYTQPGGENYREVLVQLEGNTNIGEVVDHPSKPGRYAIRRPDGSFVPSPTEASPYSFPTRETADDINASRGRLSKDVFTASHWDEPNVLTHVRMTDRNVGGDKTLFIEEIQSDWHQKGRAQGYRGTDSERDATMKSVDEIRTRLIARQDEILRTEGAISNERASADPELRRLTDELSEAEMARQRVRSTIPDAPFKKTDEWVGLAFRRALQEAAEGGYDRVAWVSGEQAANLYDLRKQVSKIEYFEDSNSLRAFGLDGREVMSESGVRPENLADYVGKEPARRIMEQRPEQRAGGMRRAIEGDDLAVGGQGMDEFYNRIVPNVVKREAKRLGVEIEPVAVTGGGGDFKVTEMPSGHWLVEDADGNVRKSFARYEEETAAEYARQLNASTPPRDPTNLSIRLTPMARERILNEGQRIGATLPGVAKTLGSTALGAAGGAALAPEGHKAEGTAAGAAFGLGIPLILTKLKGAGKAVAREAGDAVAPTMAERAQVKQIAQAADRITPPPGDFSDIDPAFIRIAKFANDPAGDQALADAVRRIDPQKTVETHAELRDAVTSMGLTGNDILSVKGRQLTRHEMIGLRDVVNRNVKLQSEIMRKLETGAFQGEQAATEAHALLDAVENQTDALLSRFIKDRSEDGRNLAAHKILANQTLDPFVWSQRAKRRLGPDVPLPTEIAVAINKHIEDGDVAKLIDLMNSLERSPVSGQLTALWKAGLLSAPPTHIVNVVSTAGNVALERLKDYPAAGVDRLLAAMLQGAAYAGSKIRGHAAPVVGRSKTASGSVLRTIGRSVKRGGREIVNAMKGRGGSMEKLSRWDYHDTTIDFVPTWMGGKVLNPGLDGYQKLVFRSLTAEDKFLKAVRLEQSVLDQAHVAALRAGDRKIAGKLYDGWRADGYAELPDDVHLQAVYDAEVATFTDNTELRQVLSGFKQRTQQGLKRDPTSLTANVGVLASEAIAPFTGTPTNIVTRVVEYSGAGILGGTWDASRLLSRAYAGEPVDMAMQRQAVESIGRGLTGVGFLAVGAMLYRDGKMTLNYPGDGGERGNWEVLGKQEFSILQDGVWNSMERFSPIGNLLAVGGYWARAMDRTDAEPLGIAAETSFGIGSMVMNQSFLESTNRFLEALKAGEDPDSGTTAVSSWVKSQASSIVPSIMRRVAASIDTDANGQVVVRRTDTWQEAIQANVPFLRDNLPLGRDQFGSVLTRKGPGSEFFDLTYSRLSKAELDGVRAEMARLGAPITRRTRDRAGGETSQQFSRRLGVEGREIWEALDSVMKSDMYRFGVYDQASDQAITPGAVREVADNIRRELIAKWITNTRSAQTTARKEGTR